MSNKLCEKSFTVWMIWNSIKAEWLHTVKSFLASVFLPHILWSWARNHRNGVRFPKRPQNVTRSFRRSGPTFHFWARLLASYGVELGLTGPTSISQNSRTTACSPLRYSGPMIRPWAFALVSYKIGANNLANFCLNLFQRSCFSKYFSLAIVQFLKSFINSSSTCLANCSL